MNEGDVVLAPLPQADGRVKNRPTIALRRLPGFGDWLLCGVSSQLRQEIAGFDDPIRPGHLDFGTSGLKAPSLIRLGSCWKEPAGSGNCAGGAKAAARAAGSGDLL